MFKKSPLKATRLAKHKRRKLLFEAISFFIVLMLLMLGLAWLSHANMLAITDVKVEGNAAVDTNEIKNIIQKDISGSYYFLFSRSNKFLYPKDKIRADLLEAFPRLADAKPSIESGHTLAVAAAERSPAYTWCTGTPNSSAEGSCYFMDNQGYIFSKSPEFSHNIFFAFYGLADPTDPIGSHYLNEQTLSSVSAMTSFLEGNSIHAYALEAESSGDYNLYVGSGSRIIFKNDENVSDLMTDLQAIIQNTSVFGRHGTSTLDYIDMRYGNKVYYKYVGN